MAARIIITRNRLKEVLDYDPETGIFRWAKSPSRFFSGTVGNIAGHRSSNKYWKITVDGRSYPAHRLAFLYMTGAWPKNEVDHRDLDYGNNRWSNLREATRSQNIANVRIRADNTTGFKGVSFHKKQRKYNARIMLQGMMINLGSFTTAEQAYKVYCIAAKLHFDEYARTE